MLRIGRMVNSRFAVALHVLTLLASRREEPATSESLADSVNTNPVVIRRLLAALRAAGLVTSKGGPGGGWRLARPAAQVTMRDVLLATEGDALFSLHPSPPNRRCPVGRTIQSALEEHFSEARDALDRQFERTTVQDLVRETVATPPPAGKIAGFTFFD